MRFARPALVIVALSFITVAPLRAESKWSFKKMVPSWGKKDEAPRDLYPEAEKPSMWTRMSDGTKSFFAKTKDAIPDWFMPGTQDRAQRSIGSLKKSDERLRGEVRTARRNFFAPWADKSESEDRPETVSDFLGQPRPE